MKRKYYCLLLVVKNEPVDAFVLVALLSFVIGQMDTCSNWPIRKHVLISQPGAQPNN